MADDVTLRPRLSGRAYLMISTFGVAAPGLVVVAAVVSSELIPGAVVVAAVVSAWSVGRVRLTLRHEDLVIVNRFRTYKLLPSEVRLREDDAEVGLGQMGTVAIQPPPGSYRFDRMRGRVAIEAGVTVRAETRNQYDDVIRTWLKRRPQRST